MTARGQTEDFSAVAAESHTNVSPEPSLEILEADCMPLQPIGRLAMLPD